MIFFTADMHFGHANIIKYCDRPFKNLETMDKALINNWNQRVKPGDTVYHLGDFTFRGGREGGKNAAQFYEDQLNGKVVHLMGNHDKNNSVKNSIYEASIFFDNKAWKMVHDPQDHVFHFGATVPVVYLNGHVHTAWKYQIREDNLLINVGIDMWKFMPITMPELIKYANRLLRQSEQQ